MVSLEPTPQWRGGEMNRHPVRLALCVLFGGLAILIGAGPTSRLAAQTADESSPRLFTDKLEVRIVEVEVVATDKAGNSVTGLTKDDFELYEDGKPVTVTNFYAIDGGREVAAADFPGAAPGTEPAEAPATPAPHRQLNLVVFVDNLNTSPLQRNHVDRSRPRSVERPRRSGRPGDGGYLRPLAPRRAAVLPRPRPGLRRTRQRHEERRQRLDRRQKRAPADSLLGRPRRAGAPLSASTRRKTTPGRTLPTTPCARSTLLPPSPPAGPTRCSGAGGLLQLAGRPPRPAGGAAGQRRHRAAPG